MFNVIDVLGFFYFGLLGNLVVVAVDFLEDCSVEFLLEVENLTDGVGTMLDVICYRVET